MNLSLVSIQKVNEKINNPDDNTHNEWNLQHGAIRNIMVRKDLSEKMMYKLKFIFKKKKGGENLVKDVCKQD